VESCDANGLALCSLRNKFPKGTALEAVGPDLRPFPFTVDTMTDLEGAPLEEPRTPQMKFYLQLPQPVPAYTILRKSVDLSAK
jgi:putative protease